MGNNYPHQREKGYYLLKKEFSQKTYIKYILPKKLALFQ